MPYGVWKEKVGQFLVDGDGTILTFEHQTEAQALADEWTAKDKTDQYKVHLDSPFYRGEHEKRFPPKS
ncbi:MAG: hypothetical protein ACRENE_15215 [Polyangiaceae bacterium]